jgi:SHAQKYF class myb-like DNA-binding protein
MHGISGIPYLFTTEEMETLEDTESEQERIQNKKRSRSKWTKSEKKLKDTEPEQEWIQYKARKKWTATEKKLFDSCFTSLLHQQKDPKYIRPKMIQQKLREYAIDVSRTQVASYLQKYRLKKFGNKKH